MDDIGQITGMPFPAPWRIVMPDRRKTVFIREIITSDSFGEPCAPICRIAAIAVIPSNVKVGPPGTSIDLPLGHKDNPWSFDHFDTMTLSVPDGPGPDEIVIRRWRPPDPQMWQRAGQILKRIENFTIRTVFSRAPEEQNEHKSRDDGRRLPVWRHTVPDRRAAGFDRILPLQKLPRFGRCSGGRLGRICAWQFQNNGW
jgi:hypothetical protein